MIPGIGRSALGNHTVGGTVPGRMGGWRLGEKVRKTVESRGRVGERQREGREPNARRETRGKGESQGEGCKAREREESKGKGGQTWARLRGARLPSSPQPGDNNILLGRARVHLHELAQVAHVDHLAIEADSRRRGEESSLHRPTPPQRHDVLLERAAQPFEVGQEGDAREVEQTALFVQGVCGSTRGAMLTAARCT